MVKKGQLEVSKMDSPKQGQDRDPGGPTVKEMEGQGSAGAGTARQKRSAGSQSQSRARPCSAGSKG